MAMDGRELGDALHRHVVVVEHLGHPRHDLHRRVHLEAPADAPPHAAALEQGRGLDRPAAHDDVVGRRT